MALKNFRIQPLEHLFKFFVNTSICKYPQSCCVREQLHVHLMLHSYQLFCVSEHFSLVAVSIKVCEKLLGFLCVQYKAA